MQTLNKVFLLGRIGNDPETSSSQKGTHYTRLRVATTHWRKGEDGGREDTMWHTVFVWGKQGDLCAQYLKKGAPVMVEGYLSSYSTENKEGEIQWKSSVTAEKVGFLPNPARGIAEAKFDS